jgi:O-methyltransferase involved in polyketide biosynthesis
MNNPLTDKIQLSLAGVPETLLWPLHFRAFEARKNDGFFSDPLGVAITDRIDYDFSKFGKPNFAHAVRAKFSDDLVHNFLARNPGASVVSLGEGLETQFWRVDDGKVIWLSVDLPEPIAARRRLLPADPRNSLLECSALDPAWIDSLDTTKPAFVIAAGLLMYFQQADVHSLLSTISARLPRSEMFFDTIPPWLSRRTLRGWSPTKHYTTPRMPFGICITDIAAFAATVPGMKLLRVCAYPEPYPKRTPLLSLVGKIPWVRKRAPALVHAHFQTSH